MVRAQEEVEEGEIREGTKATEGIVFPAVSGRSAVEPYSPEFMNGLAKTCPPYPTGRNVVSSLSINGERRRIVVKVTPKRKSSQKDHTPEKRINENKEAHDDNNDNDNRTSYDNDDRITHDSGEQATNN